jgi:branched-chain amino acid transport system permease protein
VVDGYLLGVGVLFLINLLLVISYRTITTMGGWSFAHITMLAVGAYTMAILQTRFGVSFWLILPLSGAAAAIIALVIAWPVMRTRQFYFFLSTFAAGEAIRQCFIQFKGAFGGIEGIPFLSPPSKVLGLNFYDPVNFYFMALVAVMICIGLLYTFDRGRTGRAVVAMAENENLSLALGTNAWALKTLAFCVGSFFAGIAGALFAGYNGFVAPTDFSAGMMFKVIAALIIGGNRTFLGPILGLILLTVLDEVLRDLSQLVPLIYGMTIILTVLFLPQGLEGLARRIFAQRSAPNADGEKGVPHASRA